MKNKMHLFRDIKSVWPLLVANICYYIFIGMAEAVIWQKFYEILSPRLISLNSAIGWAVGIFLGLAWSKWGNKLLKFLIPLHLAQLIIYSVMFIYFEASLNMFMFWLLGLLLFITIGGLCDKICLCSYSWFFRKPEERSSYDNLEAMASCISGCAGYLIAVAYVPSLRMAIFYNFLGTFLYCLFVLVYSVPRRKILIHPDNDVVAE